VSVFTDRIITEYPQLSNFYPNNTAYRQKKFVIVRHKNVTRSNSILGDYILHFSDQRSFEGD
jgi:hypothetical protein